MAKFCTSPCIANSGPVASFKGKSFEIVALLQAFGKDWNGVGGRAGASPVGFHPTSVYFLDSGGARGDVDSRTSSKNVLLQWHSLPLSPLATKRTAAIRPRQGQQDFPASPAWRESFRANRRH